MKNEIILAGVSAGFFRAKSPEKKTLAIAEILELEQFAGKDDEVAAVLEAEELRRAVVSQSKADAKARKDIADANKPVSGGVDSAQDHVVTFGPGAYVITTAQNNTDVNPVFLSTLQSFAEHVEARILCAKTTYNKNGFLQPDAGAVDGVWYDPKITKYLVSGHIALSDELHFIADANVLPTAKNPLSSFEAVTGAGVSIIIPAVKIALNCVAALAGGRGKNMYATGAVTKRNYVLRKAGAVAIAEHNIGALYVVVNDDGSFVARQLELMDGDNGFYDHGTWYDVNGAIVGDQSPAALQLGDIHAEKMTDENRQKIALLIRDLHPLNLIIHDVLDFSSRNHHNIKDSTFVFNQLINENTVKKDLETVTDVLDDLISAGPDGMLGHIIESNHDLAINTWLKNADFKLDPINALVYLQCMHALYAHIEEHGNTDFNMLEYAYKEIGNGGYEHALKFHTTDESVVIAGIEMGCHGHTGINGAKGSPTSFRKLGVKMNTGHTHTPSIVGGVYTAGVSASLEMGYNIGPSSWRLAHIVTYPNGQRQIIEM